MRVIAGTARGARLAVPAGLEVRPTSDRARERLFAIVEPWLPEAACLDLFAGSGALGIEALSRGAESCVFVERSRRALEAIRDNLERTRLAARAEVIGRPVETALARMGAEGRAFDLVLADPPYDRPALLAGALETLRALGLVAEGGLVAVETPADAEPLPEGWEEGRSLDMGATRIRLCRPLATSDS